MFDAILTIDASQILMLLSMLATALIGMMVGVVVETSAIKTVETQLKEARDAYEKKCDEIDARGDDALETEDESKWLADQEKKISALSQKHERLSKRQEMQSAGKRKMNLLGPGATGSTVGKSEESETEEGKDKDKVDIRNQVESFTKSSTLGYGQAGLGKYLLDIKEACTSGKMSKPLQHLQEKGGFSAEHGFCMLQGFAQSSNGAIGANNQSNGCDPCDGPDDQAAGALLKRQTVSDRLLMLDGGEEDALYAAMQPSTIPMDQPSIKIPYLRDKDHRGGLFGGVVVTDKPDAACMSRLSKMKFGKMELEVGGTYALACFHRLLLQNSPISLTALFNEGVSRALRWDRIEKRLRGGSMPNRRGMFPEGDVRKNPAAIVVGRKYPGKCTLHLDDLLNMVQHAYGGGIWGASTDMLTELVKLQIAVGKEFPFFQYMPGSSQGVLLGRQIYFNDEFFGCCELKLFNTGHYIESQFSGPEFGMNPWLLWLCDQELFKVTVQEAGAPWWECPLVPRRCQVPKSPFICLGDEWQIPECPEMDTKSYEIKMCKATACCDGDSKSKALKTKDPIVNALSSNGEKPLGRQTKGELLQTAASLGVEADAKWATKKIRDAIKAKKDTTAE